MSVRGEKMNVPVGEHSLGPVARLAPEISSQRPRCDLHPNTISAQLLDRLVAIGDPPQTLGVCEDRYVSGDEYFKKELL